MPRLTTVMYHYVRPAAALGGLNGLALDDFRAQLDHLARVGTVVAAHHLLAALAADAVADLPAEMVLLTFDDGYRDHLDHVLPELLARRLPAAFYPVAAVVTQQAWLAANRLHLVLARAPLAAVRAAVDAATPADRRADYAQAYLKPNLWDPAPVNYVKRMLQVGLPEEARTAVLDALFARHVTADPADLHAAFYCSAEDLRTLRAAGMHIGGHSATHAWMTALDDAGRRAEVAGSLALLRRLGQDTTAGRWSFCYPFGGHDPACEATLADAGCGMAFTVEPRMEALPGAARLRLGRLDTNHLPPRGSGGPWT